MLESLLQGNSSLIKRSFDETSTEKLNSFGGIVMDAQFSPNAPKEDDYSVANTSGDEKPQQKSSVKSSYLGVKVEQLSPGEHDIGVVTGLAEQAGVASAAPEPEGEASVSMPKNHHAAALKASSGSKQAKVDKVIRQTRLLQLPKSVSSGKVQLSIPSGINRRQRRERAQEKERKRKDREEAGIRSDHEGYARKKTRVARDVLRSDRGKECITDRKEGMEDVRFDRKMDRIEDRKDQKDDRRFERQQGRTEKGQDEQEKDIQETHE